MKIIISRFEKKIRNDWFWNYIFNHCEMSLLNCVFYVTIQCVYYVTIQSDLALHQIRCDAISIAIRIFTQRIKAIKDMNGSMYQGKSYYIKFDKSFTNTFVYGLLTCIDFMSILEDMCFHLKCKYGDLLELVFCLFLFYFCFIFVLFIYFFYNTKVHTWRCEN